MPRRLANVLGRGIKPLLQQPRESSPVGPGLRSRPSHRAENQAATESQPYLRHLCSPRAPIQSNPFRITAYFFFT
jgi:hypothetical protein